MPNKTDASKRPRRFLPEPIEISSRSSKDRPLGHPRSGPKHHPAGKLIANDNVPTVELEHCPPSLFSSTNEIPHTAQDTEQKHKDKQTQIVRGQATVTHTPSRAEQTWKGHACAQPDNLTGGESQTRQRRKFTPLLVETASHSVRGGSRPHNTSNCPIKARPESLQHLNIMNNVKNGYSTAPESSFSYKSLQWRYETRRHSFRVPDLPAIPSSCSGSSDESELASSPPSKKPIKESPNYYRARRESCDEEISSYLLSLAAQAAEQQLKEQALAAFPNEQVYQPVDHFAIDNEDEECSHDEGSTLPAQLHNLHTRRDSAADLSSEIECLRFYKQRAGLKTKSKLGTAGNFLPQSESLTHPLAIQGGSMDVETSSKPAQNGRPASPPMLGDDLIFPQSLSPDTTIYESGKSVTLAHKTHNNPGLWHASSHCDARGGGGLWMGTCKNNGRAEIAHLPTDIMQESMSVSAKRISGFTSEDLGSGSSRATANGVDLRNTVMNMENPSSYPFDDFVTQIYNYLSLGYPCVARYYDHELSNVSGISVVELRQDDIRTDAKGFVFKEHEKINRNETSNTCMRWHALRLYIHEWSNRHPCVPEDDGNHEKWGVLERKGSWAI